MADAAIVEKEAMQLSDVERAVLAERLLESISPTSKSLQSAWVKESEDRLDSYRKGEISAVDGPQAMAEIRKKFTNTRPKVLSFQA